MPILDGIRSDKHLAILERAVAKGNGIDLVAIERKDLTVQCVLEDLDCEWLPDDHFVFIIRVVFRDHSHSCSLVPQLQQERLSI